MEVADVAQIHKVPDHASVFLNTSSSNTTNYRLIISQFLKKAGVCTVLEICCVRCEEEWGEDSSLRGSSASGASWRHRSSAVHTIIPLSKHSIINKTKTLGNSSKAQTKELKKQK